MYPLLSEIIFKNYKTFLFVGYFILVVVLLLIFFFNNDSNSTLKKKNNIKSFSDEAGDDSDPEKLKKILKILLYISFFLIGGIFLYYYGYIFYIPEEFTIEKALEQLKTLIPEEKYNQISAVVLEMINRPDKVSKGLHLLHLIKTLLKEDFPSKFEKIMDDIISYFEGKK